MHPVHFMRKVIIKMCLLWPSSLQKVKKIKSACRNSYIICTHLLDFVREKERDNISEYCISIFLEFIINCCRNRAEQFAIAKIQSKEN